jgi:hypothetical protein
MSAFEYKNSDFQNGFSSDIAGFIERPVSLHKLNEMVLYIAKTSHSSNLYI